VTVARLPDGGDINLILNQFNFPEGRTNANWGSGLVIANVERPYAEAFARILNTNTQWSLPENLNFEQNYPVPSISQNAYFILHGHYLNPFEWTGEDPNVQCYVVQMVGGDYAVDCRGVKYPQAWNANWAGGANSQGTIVSGACYGAFIGFTCDQNFPANHPVRVADSIALTYLSHGAEAFIGHTASTYSYVYTAEVSWCLPWPFDDVCGTRKTIKDWPVDQGGQAVEWFTLSEIAKGVHPLDAYAQAKAILGDNLGPGAELFSVELKALHSYVYYGLPPAPK